MPNTNMLHVRFEGHSHDLSLDQLDITHQAADADVRQAVAAFVDVGLHRLEAYVVERHNNGNLTLRPEAVFGRSLQSGIAIAAIVGLLACSESPESKTDSGPKPDSSSDTVVGEKIAGLEVSESQLGAFVGSKKGILVWVEGADRVPKILDFRQADPQVSALAEDDNWINPLISPDGTRVVYSKGSAAQAKSIMVRKIDGGEPVEIAKGDVGYWQKDGEDEYIVYCDQSSKHENGKDGKTYRRKLVAGDVATDGEAETVHDRAMDGGPNGSGDWLGQVYNNLWAYNRATKKEYETEKFFLLDGTVADHQSCNGSMAPDGTARLMALVIPHDFVRIYTFSESDDSFKESSRFLLPGDMAEWEFPEWSTAAGYFTAILMKTDRKHRLNIVKIKEGEITPDVLQIAEIDATYSHLYLE